MAQSSFADGYESGLAHGIQVEFFQDDAGIQKAGYYDDQFLYQNCHGLIDGIQ